MSDPPKSSREKSEIPFRGPLVNPFTTQGMIRDPRLFFGRTTELAAIWGYLRKDANVSIVAERRMGKSSLLWYVHEKAPGEMGADTLVRYIDMEVVATEADLFSRMAEALKLPDAAATRDIERALAEQRLVLCLDEFDRTANNFDAFPLDFFALLRGLSQSQNLTLVVATKQPLIDFSTNGTMTSPFYNIFPPTPITLGPLADEEARALLTQTAALANLKFNDELVAKAVKLAEGLPWHLQLIGAHLVESGLNWEEAERRFRESLTNGTPKTVPTKPPRRAPGRRPDFGPLTSVLVALAAFIGAVSLGFNYALGLYVTLVLAALVFSLMIFNLLYARRR
jgi:hypothetical protein